MSLPQVGVGLDYPGEEHHIQFRTLFVVLSLSGEDQSDPDWR